MVVEIAIAPPEVGGLALRLRADSFAHAFIVSRVDCQNAHIGKPIPDADFERAKAWIETHL